MNWTKSSKSANKYNSPSNNLNSPITIKEIHSILLKLHQNISPGPDGFIGKSIKCLKLNLDIFLTYGNGGAVCIELIPIPIMALMAGLLKKVRRVEVTAGV